MAEALENNQVLIDGGYHLIGDDAYKTSHTLVTPWAGKNADSAKSCYNYYHSAARVTIERAFGMRPGFEPVTLGKSVQKCAQDRDSNPDHFEKILQHGGLEPRENTKSGLAGIRTCGESESMPYGRPCTRFTLLGLRSTRVHLTVVEHRGLS